MKFFVEAGIASVKPVRKGGKVFVEVRGAADADRFKKARIEIGKGKDPGKWKTAVKKVKKSSGDGVLGAIPATELQGAAQWTVRLVVEHKNGRMREARYLLKVK
jgi:hypothetical protein